jgi:cobaltochelatase CobS
LEEKVKDALRKHLLTRKEALLAAPAATPVVKKVEKKKEVVVKTGQRLFSEIVKPLRLSADLPDFAVSVLDPATLDSRVSAFVPKLDPSYVIQVKEAHALMMAWEMSEKCLITGPTGSGKSSLVQYCCALTNRPMIRVNMTGDMESHVLFGTLTVENGSTVWKDGPVTEGVLYGCVVCIDEWDVTPPEIFFSMQWLLEREGKLFLKEKPGDSSEKMMQPHGDFRLVCLGNTVGQGDDTGRYSGTNVQNTASVDRFDTTVVLSYLDKTHELGVLKSQCKELDADVAGKMVTMAALVRQACDTSQINLTMSPRTLINWGLKQTVYDTRTALALAFLNKLRESDRKIVEEMYYKVFGR